MLLTGKKSSVFKLLAKKLHSSKIQLNRIAA